MILSYTGLLLMVFSMRRTISNESWSICRDCAMVV